ncbi:MAG: imidazolonepropionase, partial [Henriciella sp.]|nr:imidazolonepropionase [Henriciella sp.]
MEATNTPRRILRHARLATMTGDDGYGLIDDGEITIQGDVIAHVGKAGQRPADATDAEVIDLKGRLVTPGLIDCHTHLVHAGSRAREFEMRLEGATYEQIARAGGGIFSTVKATRAASEDELLESALTRLDAFLSEGVTTIEVKSGYGLDLQTERKMLRTARKLADERRVRVHTTFLGAHAVPAGLDADTYLDTICLPAMRELASDGLIDAVDGFCETIAFSPQQIERVFETALELELPIKLHAEQLSALGGSSLAARHGALSSDHLEYATADDIAAMKKSGTVAVILPGAFYFLRETQKPPIDLIRDAGVRVPYKAGAYGTWWVPPTDHPRT